MGAMILLLKRITKTDDCLLTPLINNGELKYPSFMSTCNETEALERHFSGNYFG